MTHCAGSQIDELCIPGILSNSIPWQSPQNEADAAFARESPEEATRSCMLVARCAEASTAERGLYLARRCGVTLIGRARRQRFPVCNDPQRIDFNA